jgi:hypothetical protein
MPVIIAHVIVLENELIIRSFLNMVARSSTNAAHAHIYIDVRLLKHFTDLI